VCEPVGGPVGPTTNPPSTPPPPGSSGSTGSNGSNGSSGSNGSAGSQGSNGSSGSNGSNGSQVAEYAADLFLQNYGKYLIFAGGYGKMTLFTRPEAEVSSQREVKNAIFAARQAVENAGAVSRAQAAKQELGIEIPSALVPLPSKGLVYPVDSPLHNREEIEIKGMTTQEEDILIAALLIQLGFSKYDRPKASKKRR
jgi:hypothetical protein